MKNIEALKIISKHRGDAIVLATMTSNFEWPQVSENPDFDLMFTGSMGKASSLGLGLALAIPERKVIVLDGDGSILMNLGSLVTIANMAPPNLLHFVFENTVYQTTGGQPVPASGKVNLRAIAEGAGIPAVYGFEKLEDLNQNIAGIMGKPGPTFISVRIPPATERPPYPLVLTSTVIDRFRAALERNGG